MKKSIILSIATLMTAATIFTSCGKKTNCVCTIDGTRYEYDLSNQNGVNRKTTCDAMKMSMNFSGAGSCKLEK